MTDECHALPILDASEPRRRPVNSAHDLGPTRMRVMSLGCAVGRGYAPLTCVGREGDNSNIRSGVHRNGMCSVQTIVKAL